MANSKQEKNLVPTAFGGPAGKSRAEYTSFDDAFGYADEEKLLAVDDDAASNDDIASDHCTGDADGDRHMKNGGDASSSWEVDWHGASCDDDAKDYGGDGDCDGDGDIEPDDDIEPPAKRTKGEDARSEEAPKEDKAAALASRLHGELLKISDTRGRVEKLAKIREMLQTRKEQLRVKADLTNEKMADLLVSLERCANGEPQERASHPKNEDEGRVTKEDKTVAFASRLRAELGKVAEGKARLEKLATIKEMLKSRRAALRSAAGLTDEKMADLLVSLDSCSLPDSTDGWRQVQECLFGKLPPLPPAWIRIKSRSKDLVYFFNIDTQESRREQPTS